MKFVCKDTSFLAEIGKVCVFFRNFAVNAGESGLFEEGCSEGIFNVLAF